MKILHVLLTQMPIPPKDYGGTERVLWALLLAQREMGHEVRLLLKANANNADYVDVFNPNQSMAEQVDGWADIIHFHWPFQGEINTPFICTEHGNNEETGQTFPKNTVYLSRRHAKNHGSNTYVHNGLYWPDYGNPELSQPKNYTHFLAKANWKIKNLQGAVQIARSSGHQLHILGGKRISLKRKKYIFLGKDLHFHGMIGGAQKNELIKFSKALIFPVLWHEPFGLAIIESLYLGCPIFASPYGSLPDIISNENFGFLSDSYSELAQALTNVDQYDRRTCHEHAKEHFNHMTMAKAYQQCYERVLDGENLNSTNPQSKLHKAHSLDMRA